MQKYICVVKCCLIHEGGPPYGAFYPRVVVCLMLGSRSCQNHRQHRGGARKLSAAGGMPEKKNLPASLTPYLEVLQDTTMAKNYEKFEVLRPETAG